MRDHDETICKIVKRPFPGRDDAIMIAISPMVDCTNVIDMERQLKQMQEDGICYYIVDFSGVRYCNCTGLGGLVATADNLEKLGGAWFMHSVNPKIAVVFEMLGLDSFFRMFPDEASAIAAMRLKFASGGPVARDEKTEVLKRATPFALEAVTCKLSRVLEARMSGDFTARDLDYVQKRVHLLRTPLTKFLLLDVTDLASLDRAAEGWLVQLGGELIRRGGCVALAGLSDAVQTQLNAHDCYSAFEHYAVMPAARKSIEAVLNKDAAYVQTIHPFNWVRAVSVDLAEHLGAGSERQIGQNLDALIDETPWLQNVILDASRVNSLAPAVEVPITRAATKLLQRNGTLALAGLREGLHASLGKDAGKKLYKFYASVEGAVAALEDEA